LQACQLRYMHAIVVGELGKKIGGHASLALRMDAVTPLVFEIDEIAL